MSDTESRTDPEGDAVPPGSTGGEPVARQVPGQPPGAAVPPVPVPGDVPGATVPNVSVGQAASPKDGIRAGNKSEGSDSSVVSPAAYVTLNPPGSPDGEVDTRV